MKKHGLILIMPEHQPEVLEQMFALPPEEREAFLREQVKLGRAEYLGSTDKSAPELATELIKHGIKAKSYIKGEKRGSKQSPTLRPDNRNG